MTGAPKIDELLRHARLPQADHVTLSSPRFARPLHVVAIDHAQARSAWVGLRARFEQTGYWPLIVSYITNGAPGSWREVVGSETDDLFNRFEFEMEVEIGRLDDPDPAAVLRASRLDDPQRAIAERVGRFHFDRVEEVSWIVEVLQQQFGAAPAENELLQALDREPRPSRHAVERVAFDWLLRHGGLKKTTDPFWYEPTTPMAMLLLPIAAPEDALAYIHWYGAGSIGSGNVIALLRQWREKDGAELMCHYGTVLQLHVARPVQSAQRAFEIAGDLEVICMQENAIESAAAILGSTHWHLHNRP